MYNGIKLKYLKLCYQSNSDFNFQYIFTEFQQLDGMDSFSCNKRDLNEKKSLLYFSEKIYKNTDLKHNFLLLMNFSLIEDIHRWEF